MSWKDDPIASGPTGGSWKDDAPAPFLERAARYGRGLLDSAVNGITFGFGDELAAGTDALTQPLTGSSMGGSQAPTFGQRYDENLAAERGRQKQFAQTNPVASTVANVGGAVGTAVLGAPLAVVKGGGLVANSARGALAGATLGGVQGFGEGEGGFDPRMQNATKGAAIGGALGGALPVAGAGVGHVYQWAAPKVLNRVADMAEGYVPKVSSTPLSAAAPEGGQVAGDSLATRLADNARITAGNIEGDAAVSRLALELSRSGGTRKAAQRLADMGDEAFIADTSKGAERLANVGYILPGEAADKYKAAFKLRNEGTGDRFEAALPKTRSVADTQRFFEGYKSATGSDIYDPVLRGQAQLNISPEMRALMQRPAIREAMDQIRADAAHYGKDLTEAEVAHLVKQTLNANTDAAFKAGKAINKDMVRGAGDAWERALYEANPAIQKADEAYANLSSLSNRKTGEGLLERGQRFMKSGTSDEAVDMSPSALAHDLPQLDPRQLLTFQVGTTDTMRNMAQAGPKSTRRLADKLSEGNYMRQKLEQIYGPAKAAEIIKRGDTEKAFAETANKVMGGSETAQRTAALGDELALGGGLPTTPGRALAWLMEHYSKVREPSEAVRSRLADLLANPDAAANAETLALVDAMLKRQAAARSYSSGVAGGTGGTFSRNP